MFFGNNHLLFLIFEISGWSFTTLRPSQLQETVYNTTQFKSFCASYDLAVSGPWMFTMIWAGKRMAGIFCELCFTQGIQVANLEVRSTVLRLF